MVYFSFMMKPSVRFKGFTQLDLRVGKVVEATDVDGSDKLYRLEVDLGREYGIKTIFAGVKPWYPKSDLVNRKFVFVANLEPKRMMGAESQGMMLAVEGSDKPVLLPAPEAADIGAFLR